MVAKSTTPKSKKSPVVKKNSTPVKSKKPSKATTNFADTGLNSALVGKAVKAVLKYHEKVTEGGSSEKLTLLGNDRPVQVQITLLRAPGQSKPKPTQIVIPHPFYKLADNTADGVEEPEICLIVKESSKEWCQTMIEKFPDHMGCVKKVLSLDSLRKKHSSFEQKRELLSKYNMFMADDRILPMLSKALGKAFIKAKRLPIPINLTREAALPFAIQKALSATYMTVNTGTCISIRAGHTGMEPKNLTENIIAIAKKAAYKIPRSWANVQMVSIKTADSVSLPVYNKTPEALREIAKLAGVNADVGVSDDKEEGSSKDNKPGSGKKKKDLKSPLLQALKKQKGAAEEKKETPKKKTKSDNDINDKESPTKKRKVTKEKSDKTPEKTMTKKSASPVPTSSTKKKQKKVEEKNETKEFVAMKKFKSSKKGYVFRMGAQGLGYYIDIKPVVDKMKMEALMRSSQQGKRGNYSKNSRRKGGRRSH
jgi:ribosome biogenesis protein UTP30